MSFWKTYWIDFKKDAPVIIGVSILIGLIITLSFCTGCWNDIGRFFRFTLHGTIISMVLWVGNGIIVDYLNLKVSWLNHPIRRFFIGFTASIFYTVMSSLIASSLLLEFLHGVSSKSVWVDFSFRDFILPLGITLIIMLFYHGKAFLTEWRKAVMEKEELKREHLASQYETLKNQVNPHFLFNSLNALSTLVYKDQDLAAKFIQQLSKVYRHVLETKDHEVVPLSKELEALEAYIFLLQIRFGNNLTVHLDLPHSNHYLVAPLALQMLLENAIKHNVISRSKPLHIDIFKEENYLVIKNNLQSKPQVYSSGIGLPNIKARYEYIAQKEVLVIPTEADFIVKIPLLSFQYQ